MTIDEAIAHARDVAEKKRDICKLKTRENAPSIFKCAEEYKQMADWLEELKAYKESLALKKEFYEGVKQGRSDKYQEITSEYMLLTEKQVADIRAEAIDDISDLIRSKTYKVVGMRFDNTYEMHDRALGRLAKNVLIEELLEELEQLKEQK